MLTNAFLYDLLAPFPPSPMILCLHAPSPPLCSPRDIGLRGA